MSHKSTALICDPSAIPADQRAGHFARARSLLNQQAIQRVDLADGYGFQFAADKLDELLRFIDNERRCCPFMRFELSISAESGPIWLRMTGPEGTRQVLEAELSIANTCGCPP